MNILGKSVLELKKLIETKEVSENELFAYFLRRIQKYNTKLNAYLSIEETSKTKGIPISIKDNFNTLGTITTASSNVLKNYVAPYNATVVERLLKNNFVSLGKTNMDAWAHGSSTETSDFGVSRNPWDITRVAGGSSGGAAVSVSSYLAPAAIGSETAGSIRQPASWCGTVGLKPTYGRVSRYGVIAMGSSFDCPGPITTTVSDAAYLLEILAGKDAFDATTSSAPVENYLKNLNPSKKYVVGICEDYIKDVDEDTKKAFEKSIEILKKMGHTIKKVNLLSPKYSIAVYTILQRSEVSSNLNRYDGIRYGNKRNAFGEEAKRRMMLGTYALSAGYADEYYNKAVKVRGLIIEDFKKIFNEVDIIAAPTTPLTALPVGESAKYPFFGEAMDVLTEPAAIAGIPAINIPNGLDNNDLPIGLQFMSKWLNEQSILNLAYAFEKETNFFDVIKKGFHRYE